MSSVRLRFIEAGYTMHAESMTLSGGRNTKIAFPASVAILEHPRHGVALFDTGYSPRFHEQTRRFPNRFYALITPVTIAPDQTAFAQLKTLGIQPSDVRKVILSHFHADHIGGVADFPKAEFVYRASAFEAVRDLSQLGALRAGFLRGLLPMDFAARSKALTDGQFVRGASWCPGFENGYDVFGDQSVVVVDLPGHAVGQIGVCVRELDGREYFLVADACWGREAYRELRPPKRLAGLIFDDWNAYLRTLGRLNTLSKQRPDLTIVPCHCGQTLHDLSCATHGPRAEDTGASL